MMHVYFFCRRKNITKMEIKSRRDTKIGKYGILKGHAFFVLKISRKLKNKQGRKDKLTIKLSSEYIEHIVMFCLNALSCHRLRDRLYAGVDLWDCSSKGTNGGERSPC